MKTARTGAYQVDLRAGQPMVTVGWFNSHAHAEPNRTSKDPALLRADALLLHECRLPAAATFWYAAGGKPGIFGRCSQPWAWSEGL